jgi:hypothetical protein
VLRAGGGGCGQESQYKGGSLDEGTIQYRGKVWGYESKDRNRVVGFHGGGGITEERRNRGVGFHILRRLLSEEGFKRGAKSTVRVLLSRLC